MKRIMCATIFALITYSLVSFAQEGKRIDKDLENISGQYAECTAYYEIVYHALNTSDEKEAAGAYKQLGNDAMFYSLLLANEGRSKDMAVKVTNSRIEMYKKIMKREADYRNENISILIEKYHLGCEEAMKQPPIEVVEVLKARTNEGENQSE